MSSTPQPRLGAYGFALAGLEGAKRLLSPVSGQRPVLEVASTTPGWAPRAGALTLPLEGGGALHLEREPLRAVFALPRPLAAEALVHPYLVPAAALAGEWHGLHAFHAGAFVAGGGVWGVVGGRGDGKSSFLLSLALRDVTVVTDDLLVSGGRDVFPGPRAVDLREDAHRHFGLGEAMGVLGTRARWRYRLPAAPGSLPLHGWLVLEWGDGCTVTPVAPAERVALLLQQRTLPRSPLAPPPALLALPMLRLRRPRSWASLDAAAECALAAVAETGA
jgi:hypothetical protein